MNVSNDPICFGESVTEFSPLCRILKAAPSILTLWLCPGGDVNVGKWDVEKEWVFRVSLLSYEVGSKIIVLLR